ncbi:hydrogen voltage-gated channel 1 protein [Rutstroemia sp. NJR-2017a WRK4]|nr:hydrogen voltage-gated channel 1 protein [Rutstroemia sp. NJR-2017a WRK4]
MSRPSTSSSNSSQPLLQAIPRPISSRSSYHHIPHHPHSLKNLYRISRNRVRSFLSSRTQHYIVLFLVACDLLGIFADIAINLYQCDTKNKDPKWDDVREGLSIAGLVFSSAFMLELLFSFWAFGWSYFNSVFHTFDALVISASLIIDILLHGILEEVASLVIILRLWRFFKIIEEFSVGAQEQMDGLEERIEQLEEENRELKREMGVWKNKKKGGDDGVEDLERGRRGDEEV